MNGKKEDIFMLVFIASFLISVWFLCAGRTSVHDIRERAEPLRAELNNARKEQQKQSETLETDSNTHFRAHETGRNIVCHLLLEKKKNKKKKKRTKTQ